ncbi:11-beta-hydroxysteroid dehydrogenase 1b [Quercus suber]|uniref:11-beta-hydroxysteroid dehydrogenase 1b n=1 Tax=Quercus suber TaxID=58331 RepID=A0AAW0LSA3_QUESU
MPHNHQQQPSPAPLAIADAINAARHNHPLLPLLGIGVEFGTQLFIAWKSLAIGRICMDTNFWGSIYSNHNAVPHLRKRKGKIVVLASTVAWLAMPRMSFYNVRNLLDWNALQARQP